MARAGETQESALLELQTANESALESQESRLQSQDSALQTLLAQIQAQEERLVQATLIPWPKAKTQAVAAIGAVLLLLIGALGGHFWLH